jgi:protein involved in polysaccharide export with SLBB domain
MQPSLATRCPPRPARGRRLLLGTAALVCAVLGGCAAISNPVADAVPVRQLPPEVLGQRKEDERTIPLPLLRQSPPDAYRLAAGDVLGVWIEGVLGEKTQPPPLHLPEQGGTPPAFGYPLPVRQDGTVPLPLIDPVKVEGLTVTEAQDEIIKAYTVTRKILQAGRERVIVTLMRPRTYHVLVVRQDTGAIALTSSPGAGSGGLLGQTKRGTGTVLDLPAYENDVLNALARTGGLPGLDAQNEVVIERGSFRDFAEANGPGCPDPWHAAGAGGGNVVRIPLRLRPGEPPPFRPDDVVLHNGDIVFIEARDTEVFYTGGLLPTHQWALPRDYDLDVLQAIAFVNGPLVNGAFNTNNLAGNVLQPGLGFPSPSLITILRRTPGGGQIPIRVTLDRALRDPRERVLIQPGDVVILQETVAEAITRYVSNQLKFDFLGTFIRQRDLLGTSTLQVP